LLIIWVARQIIQPQKLPVWRWAAIGLCLVGLSWLVIRFLPVVLLLLALLLFRAVRRREIGWARGVALSTTTGGALVCIAILNRSLFRAASPLGVATAGRVTTLLSQLFGPLNHFDSFLGWLLDQRMGLFLNAPIYIIALLGWLILWRRQRWPAIVLGSVLALQHLSLGFTRFQVRWGIPPRYLVAVVPLAGALLAPAWGAIRSSVFRTVSFALLAISLVTAGLVMASPLWAYANEYDDSKILRLYGGYCGVNLNRLFPMFMPAVRYKDKGWDDEGVKEGPPRTYLLPQFKALLSPVGTIVPDADAAGGLATWTAAGVSGLGLDGPRVSLPEGRYDIIYRLRAGQPASANASLAIIQIQARAAGTQHVASLLLRQELTRQELAPWGVYRDVTVTFTLASRQDISCSLLSTGAGDLWADEVIIRPREMWKARLAALFWAAVLLAFAACGYLRWVLPKSREPECRDVTCYVSTSLGRTVYMIILSLLLLAIGGLVFGYWYAFLGPRSYEGESLLSQTGRIVSDTAASGGQAIQGVVEADQAGWLAYGPYELFPEGDFRIRFTLKRGARTTNPSVAFVEITDVPAEVIMGRRDIQVTDLAEPGQYKEFSLEFTNPKWQKLVFRIYFQGTVDLWLDRVEFCRSGDWW